MAETMLESSALSAFCGSIAVMLSAGIQLDEAMHMLSENQEDSQFRQVCAAMYDDLADGKPLSDCMEATGSFPTYAVELVRAGESSGRIESVMRSLELYYDEEDRIFTKIRSSVAYPAALLCIMAVILAATVWFILPVFVGVYQNMSGQLTAGSFSSVGVSIGIGWVALILTVICAVVVLYCSMLVRTEKGRERFLNILGKIPLTRDAVAQLELSRFTIALAAYVSSGITNEDALQRAKDTVEHRQLSEKLDRAHAAMVDMENPRSLAQAIAENNIFEPFYARLLLVGSQAGSIDEILSKLSETFFDDAVFQIDNAVDGIEPALAAFLTIAVGATLIAVMLPLIGIMRSIG